MRQGTAPFGPGGPPQERAERWQRMRERMRQRPIIRYEEVRSIDTWDLLYTYVDIIGWPWLSRVQIPR